ncbi:Solute carrier family 25 member 44 [Oopsacas minuta]|uniref:Solute carrier family 25 member 44 n=1 Tax=Oopsacas minuta TaxID=111878 RepID=A0AAV7KJZ0_9METZ|nr:Solute carrier family 25 member 44 [Oopsacas minuta]
MQEQEGIQIIEWKDLNKTKFLLLSPAFFFGVRLCLYPTILVKTRLQVQAKKQVYRGAIDALFKISKQEGVRGLYKGFFVNSLGLISGQVYIITYELLRGKLSNHAPAIKGFVAGGIASILAQSITVPVDVLSQYRMVMGAGSDLGNQDALSLFKGQNKQLSSYQIAKIIFKEHGLIGFYRGYFVSLMTFTPSSAIWWACYSGLLPLLNPVLIIGVPIVMLQALSGVTAAVSSALLTNPIDVIRTRLQVGSRRTFLGEVYHLLSSEGVMGLTKGLSARLTAAIPFSICVIVTYEFVKKMSLKSPEDRIVGPNNSKSSF